MVTEKLLEMIQGLLIFPKILFCIVSLFFIGSIMSNIFGPTWLVKIFTFPKKVLGLQNKPLWVKISEETEKERK